MASSQLMVKVMGEIPLFKDFSPTQVKQLLGICKLKTWRNLAQIQAEDSGDDGEVQQQEEKTQHQARLSMLECRLRQQQQKLDAVVELLIQRGSTSSRLSSR